MIYIPQSEFMEERLLVKQISVSPGINLWLLTNGYPGLKKIDHFYDEMEWNWKGFHPILGEVKEKYWMEWNGMTFIIL